MKTLREYFKNEAEKHSPSYEDYRESFLSGEYCGFKKAIELLRDESAKKFVEITIFRSRQEWADFLERKLDEESE